MRLWLDLETRSRESIRKTTTRYASAAEIMVIAWAVDDGDVHVEDLTAGGISNAFMIAAQSADTIWAHNAEFDRTLLERDVWNLGNSARWRCTAALARMHGLPGGLDKLCEIFKLPADTAKSKDGKRLIEIFCKPTPEGTWNTRHTHPGEWARFLSYAGQDIVAMRAIHAKLPKWNATPRMWAHWHMDQRINARGIAVDLDLCHGAVRATHRAKRLLAERTEEATLGVVESTTQVVRLLAFLRDMGIDMPDLTADTVARRLEDDAVPEYVKELLRMRQQASKSSTAKYQRVIDNEVDGRVHNLLAFCGAERTGRWAGRLIQPHNLMRRTHPQWAVNEAIQLFKTDAIELFDPDDVLGLAASCLRGMLVAPEGCELAVSDLANIEGRKMAWIVGEHWKIDAFRAFDRKEGPDLYKLAYARSFGVDPATIGDESLERQVGKVMELALQYYGGVGAFCSMAEVYKLDVDRLANLAWPQIPRRVKELALEDHVKAVKAKRTYGLEQRTWVALKALVRMWRTAHPATVQFWYDLDAAAKLVLERPAAVVPVGRVSVDRQGSWVRIRLPSGRYLGYPSMRLDEDGLSFAGVSPLSRKWQRIHTYSGKLAENIVQAASADILMDAMARVEGLGFVPVLSVHDEIVTEAPKSDARLNEKRLSQVLAITPEWADGLPLAAKGFQADRYRK